MIDIKVILNNEEQIKKIKIEGHADYDIFGQDIVCASASTLLISSINHILSLDRESILYNDDGKTVTIKVLKNNENSLKILNNMVEMFQQLCDSYPNHIKIEKTFDKE